MKYLIDKYKEANEWNRKQTGGSKRKSMFYDEIDEVLGSSDIVTLSHVSEAGTTSMHRSLSPTSSETSISASSTSAASDDQSAKLKEDAGERKKKEVRNDRKKTRKSHADLEEEERQEFRESMDTFKKCGGKSKSQTQQQQMAMMAQFVGAMTQFMSKNSEHITLCEM